MFKTKKEVIHVLSLARNEVKRTTGKGNTISLSFVLWNDTLRPAGSSSVLRFNLITQLKALGEISFPPWKIALVGVSLSHLCILTCRHTRLSVIKPELNRCVPRAFWIWPTLAFKHWVKKAYNSDYNTLQTNLEAHWMSYTTVYSILCLINWSSLSEYQASHPTNIKTCKAGWNFS